ncbi:hypothetical protein EV401DRAFT_1285414 [Pisolithus croceorrhizus]|nr:hypothetical protein EV401DRAFT_1285414 [Pisolithus croceorrhizus]
MFLSCVVRFIHVMFSLRPTTATSFGHMVLEVSAGSTLCHVLRGSAPPPPIFPVSMSTVLRRKNIRSAFQSIGFPAPPTSGA